MQNFPSQKQTTTNSLVIAKSIPVQNRYIYDYQIFNSVCMHWTCNKYYVHMYVSARLCTNLLLMYIKTKLVSDKEDICT